MDPAERAFEGFVERHWDEAHRFFARGLFRELDRRNAEDCAQEVFIKLARRYRDDTATVRAVVRHERATGRAMTAAELATALGCTPAQAEERGQRCVESGLLEQGADGATFGGAGRYPDEPVVLPTRALEAMRWSAYRNLLGDYARRRIATQNARTGDLEGLMSGGLEPIDAHPGPARAAQDAELHRQVAACLDALPKPERAVLIAHYFYGLSFPELAASPAGATLAFGDAPGARAPGQLVQRLKDVAKAGRRQLKRRCPHLAGFLVAGEGGESDG